MVPNPIIELGLPQAQAQAQAQAQCDKGRAAVGVALLSRRISQVTGRLN